MNQWYNIYAFKWYKELNTFICDSEPIPGIHPIGKEQFYIVNDYTGGFRRFRYVKSFVTELDNVIYNEFVSEDGIHCTVRSIKNKTNNE